MEKIRWFVDRSPHPAATFSKPGGFCGLEPFWAAGHQPPWTLFSCISHKSILQTRWCEKGARVLLHEIEQSYMEELLTRLEIEIITFTALLLNENALHWIPRSSITLFPYQKQALSWLLWREVQSPAGGILADDMGLGKTLTMVCLILKVNELEEALPEAKKQDTWNIKGVSKLIQTKTTLIICPASLLGQ